MTDTKAETKINTSSVPEREMRAAFSGPALAANKFYVTVGQPGVRIAFAEAVPDAGEFCFRNAVVLHPADAILLHRLLREMLKDLEKKFVEGGAIPAETGNG